MAIIAPLIMSQNYWNPFRDWNQGTERPISNPYRLKTTETLLGIETIRMNIILSKHTRLKTTETLLGIETKASCAIG